MIPLLHVVSERASCLFANESWTGLGLSDNYTQIHLNTKNVTTNEYRYYGSECLFDCCRGRTRGVPQQQYCCTPVAAERSSGEERKKDIVVPPIKETNKQGQSELISCTTYHTGTAVQVLLCTAGQPGSVHKYADVRTDDDRADQQLVIVYVCNEYSHVRVVGPFALCNMYDTEYRSII